MTNCGNHRVLYYKEALSNHGYEMKEQIGSGGYAACYIVSSVQYQGMEFVAKITDLVNETKKDLPSTFQAELNALTTISHPNIINMFDYFIENDSLFLILEYCCGGTVQDILMKEGRILSHKLIEYTYQIVKALKFCEDHGFAHRDIKPSNLFIDKYGRLKLADFGFAYRFKKEDFDCTDNTNHNQFHALSNHFAGSPPFMPLEILNKQQFDPRKADIWSLGMTLYVMAVGRLPFVANHMGDLKEKIKSIRELLTFPKDVDPEFIEIVRETLKIDPDERISLSQILSKRIMIAAEAKLKQDLKCIDIMKKARKFIHNNIIIPRVNSMTTISPYFRHKKESILVPKILQNHSFHRRNSGF